MPLVEPKRPFVDPGIPDRYETIRTAVQGMQPDDVARQLPNLIELIRTHSGDDEPTVRFVIGVSFSQNETLFDYMLDRVVEVDGADQPRYETVKPAVHDSHHYLVFAYPADPHFDAAALRGALLTAIEDETTETRGSGTRTDVEPSADERGSSFGKLIRQLGLGASWLTSTP